MADVILKFSQEAIDTVLDRMSADDKRYIKHFKALLSIDGEGRKIIEITQNGYLHRYYGYRPSQDDILDCLEQGLVELNRIIRNQSYLVPSTALGFEYPTVGTDG